MPSPTTMFLRITPNSPARRSRRSKCSGSQYQLTRPASAAIASCTLGETPKALSLAPILRSKVLPSRLSMVSGPTKGVMAGTAASVLEKA